MEADDMDLDAGVAPASTGKSQEEIEKRAA